MLLSLSASARKTSLTDRLLLGTMMVSSWVVESGCGGYRGRREYFYLITTSGRPGVIFPNPKGSRHEARRRDQYVVLLRRSTAVDVLSKLFEINKRPQVLSIGRTRCGRQTTLGFEHDVDTDSTVRHLSWATHTD